LDYSVKISVCSRKTDKKYKNQEQTWSYLKDRNHNPLRTTETAEEYPKLSKVQRDNAKDHGGFVGGHLKGGVRKNGNVLGRQIGCLDADSIPTDVDFPLLVELAFSDCEYFLYSTHSHMPQNPRYRLVILFSREVTEDEYPTVMRQIAKSIGLDYFDDTTYQANRMMYWASCPSNGEFVFVENEGLPLDPDKELETYKNWRDVTEWPTSSRQSEVIKRDIAKQQDPLGKDGVIGAFCRAYSIEDAIAVFLSDVYASSAVDGRYDYLPADSTAGVVIYDGMWAYSHHASDPACGKLLNAFDLVRSHKFGDVDDKASFKAMSEFSVNNDNVKTQLAEERRSQAVADFAADDVDWEKLLTLNKDGTVEDTLDNLVLIIDNDPKLGVIAYNELKSNLDFIGKPAWEPIKYPTWTDNDTSQLRCYISDVYGIYSPSKTADALNKAAAKRRHHPIREYLNSLPPWDKTPRVETLLIDHLGADDTPYVRGVTRKTIVVAVARVFAPGIKFDSILVMDGPQDKGKSTLFNKLAGDEWFNDGLTLTDMQDKTGAEKLQGYWIMEIGELTGMRKSDIDSVKSFISRRDDKYRASYGRVVESHPRQSIIVATVNSMGGFLRDPTGNRRFWPVQTPGGTTKHSWDITDDEIRQIWAEAVALWQGGEKLYLEGSVKEIAAKEQNAALETDPKEGMVRDYLARLLPENWRDLDLGARRTFLYGSDFGKAAEGSVTRDIICNMEIWAECYSKDPASIKSADSYAIAAVLRKLGWVQAEKPKRIAQYGLQRYWRKPIS
jgi:predicted P-loop ATPase